MEPTVFLANFSLFLGQLMFTFMTSICEVFPMLGTGEQCCVLFFSFIWSLHIVCLA